jgi:hypothetical protein
MTLPLPDVSRSRWEDERVRQADEYYRDLEERLRLVLPAARAALRAC